jgi:plasmid replication initiation protein
MAKTKKKVNKGIVLIKKSNNLVESKYKFDIWETRFFLSVLSQIRREDTDAQVYRIRYKDIIKIFSLKSGDSYAFLRDAAKALMNKSVRINYEENGIERVKEVHLIGTIDYLKEGHRKVDDMVNHEYIDVTIQQEMRPFLLQLSKNFTAYDLRNITKLSVYSIRLYELLKQYETFCVRTLSIDEMKAMFQVEEQYKLYSDFYRWVIKPSEAEINKHTDLSIWEIEKLKEGRKVVALRFKFRAKTEQELSKMRGRPFQETLFDGIPAPQIIEINDETPEKVKVVVINKKAATEKKKTEIAEVIEDVVVGTEATESTPQEKLLVELSPIVVTKFGVSFKMFVGLIEQYTEGEIRQAIQVTEKALQAGKVENTAGFFVGAVRNNYQDTQQQKKQAEIDKIAEKNAKVEALKKAEQDAQQQKEQAIRNESNRKMAIIKNLIKEDAPVIHQAIEELSKGMFSRGYDASKTIAENFENAMFAGGLMNIIQKIDPSTFQ